MIRPAFTHLANYVNTSVTPITDETETFVCLGGDEAGRRDDLRTMLNAHRRCQFRIRPGGYSVPITTATARRRAEVLLLLRHEMRTDLQSLELQVEEDIEVLRHSLTRPPAWGVIGTTTIIAIGPLLGVPISGPEFLVAEGRTSPHAMIHGIPLVLLHQEC